MKFSRRRAQNPLKKIRLRQVSQSCFFCCPIYNGQMLGEDKNIKDSKFLDLTVKDSFLSISYTKTSKLITALYMVTDIIDKGEPIRNKLRHLGAEIISDIHCLPSEACNKIAETMSFLNIASAMNLVSEMNCSILKKEFLELNRCIKEYTQTKPTWLEEFFLHQTDEEKTVHPSFIATESIGQRSNGHHQSSRTQSSRTRIGVQKGSTLMQALSDKVSSLSSISQGFNNFDLLKKQRREDIVRILKTDNNGLTITDIKIKAQGLPVPASSLTSCSEKTLQRELVSMVRDGVLNKTGEKRWSRYFLV